MISAAVIEALKEIVPADKVLLQEPMKLHTTFRIGGPADCLVYLENEEQLCKIQKYLRLVDVPYTVIGNGSNLLVSDQGYAGIVLVVGKHMSRIEVRDCYLEAEAGALMSQGAKALVIDLRDNPGGWVDDAQKVADMFLEEGNVASLVYRDGTTELYTTTTDGKENPIPLVVLVNEYSASASEILAGALQDNDRGTIVGRRSFGKGLVQQQIPYADGSALRLTTARYYTPTGRSIQKPYTIGDDESYEEDLWNRYRNNEFFSADSIRFADSLKRTTPGGKVVYGGGGIMPDVFVPADTTDVTKYFIEVAGRNILYRYTIEYADRHRDALNAVRTIGGLDSLLDGDRRLFDDFIAYAARKGVAPRYDDIARSHKLIEAQLRAYIGRNTSLEDDGFYAQIYPVDDVIVRAIGILNGKRDD